MCKSNPIYKLCIDHRQLNLVMTWIKGWQWGRPLQNWGQRTIVSNIREHNSLALIICVKPWTSVRLRPWAPFQLNSIISLLIPDQY